jgi:hypothetical protein
VSGKIYRKFIISDSEQAEEFYNSLITIDYDQFDHMSNFAVLSNRIYDSFIQVIGETEGTAYYPFISEKFLYPILCKTLWITYGQPDWYKHISKYYGFKLYNKIFDYSFDSIPNPILRLVTIISMLSKFEKLSVHDWHDLYLIEQDTIEYNYDWYQSGSYLTKLEEHM